MVKLKWFCASLLAVTVNGAPAVDGTRMAGEGVQVRGTAPEQRRLTALLYPSEAVSVPLNTTASFGFAVSDGLLTAMAKSGLLVLPVRTVSDRVLSPGRSASDRAVDGDLECPQGRAGTRA